MIRLDWRSVANIAGAVIALAIAIVGTVVRG